MLLGSGNPYAADGRLPQSLRLDWDDFTCGLSAANEAALGRRARWNVILYAAADNNLARQIFDNVLALKSAASSPDVHVCVLFDGPLLMDSFFARLTADGSLADDIILRFGELHSNEPKTLTLALELAAYFPADRHLVVLSGHGKGWAGALLDQNLGLVYEREPGRLFLPDEPAACYARLRERLGAVQARLRNVADYTPIGTIDVLALDACYMGSFESLSFFASEAHTLVVSEDQMPGEGYPYDRILQSLGANPDQEPDELAASLVAQTKIYYSAPARSRDVTQARLRSEAVGAVADAFVRLVLELDVTGETEYEVIRLALQHAWPFEDAGTIDLKGFVLKLRLHPVPAVRACVETFLTHWDSLVTSTAVAGGEDGPNGISIYAPKPQNFDVAYIAFSNQLPYGLGIWCRFLARYYLRSLGESAGVDKPAATVLAALEGAACLDDKLPRQADDAKPCHRLAPS